MILVTSISKVLVIMMTTVADTAVVSVLILVVGTVHPVVYLHLQE